MSGKTYQSPRGGQPQREGNDTLAFLRNNRSEILRISQSLKLKELIEHIKTFAEQDCKELKSHQLRRLYDEVRKKEAPNEIQLLRSKFAYAMARQTSKKSKDVIEFFDFVMEAVDTPEQVENFQVFFESVVAYHKFYHGSN